MISKKNCFIPVSHIYTIKNEKKLQTLGVPATGYPTRVIFTKDGRAMAASNGNGTISIYTALQQG